MRTLVVASQRLGQQRGFRVWDVADGGSDVTRQFSLSAQEHQHYEVRRCRDGAWWVPASTNPPREWASPTQILGDGGVNPHGTEQRPSGIYCWIPEQAITDLRLTPGDSRGDVTDAHPPGCP